MSHEVISSFIAIGMFVLFSLVIVGIVGGISTVICAFKERNELRLKANSRSEIYSRQGRELADLRSKIKALELINETNGLEKSEIIHNYEEELARKDKIIESLNKALASNKKKAPAAGTTEAKDAKNA